ncbi:MAG: V-type ATP synthase subunit K [Desulfurococcales archaeon]|nr:V-type ATP synthase subunit K [Desulfurococcales archaeon]
MTLKEALKLLLADRRFRTVTVLAALAAFALAFLTAPVIAGAATQGGSNGGNSSLMAKAIGSALAVGLAGIGGGYAVGVAGAAAISAVAEKRELSGTVLLYVALGEGIAIYGLLIALLVIFVL